MAYTHTTRLAAETQLSLRLSDPGKIHWVAAELRFAISEALRMWNAMTGQHRVRGTFSCTANDPFYALSAVLQDAGATFVRASSIRDRSVLSEIEYHLLEQQGLDAWAGTDQFTLEQVVRALERRRNQFLALTAVVLGERSDVMLGMDSGVVTFPDTVIGIRRAVYEDSNGVFHTLQPSDERSSTGFLGSWTTHSDPYAYSITATAPLQLRLIPPPINSGTLHTITVSTGATLDPSAGGVGILMGIPDDLVWAVKYGALADLLLTEDGDSQRAAECEQLFQLGVELAQNLPVILHAYINGQPVLPSVINKTDMLRSNWQAETAATPDTLSIIGQDLIALIPKPDADHAIALDVVRMTELPAGDGEFLQIGREYLDTLLGMAQHICTFKHGGSEHSETAPLREQFFNAALAAANQRRAVSTALSRILQTSTEPLRDATWARRTADLSDLPEEEVRSERNARRRRIRVQ